MEGRQQAVSFPAIFGLSAIITLLLCLLVGLMLGPSALVVILTLTALEITFSFDNALANVRMLRQMPPFWQRMFMTVGMVFAVFGARVFLPVAVVAIALQTHAIEVTRLAITEPYAYLQALHTVHPFVAAFGGAFLLMAFLEFVGKNIHIKQLAGPAQWVLQVSLVAIALTLGVRQSSEIAGELFFAGCLGIVGYGLLKMLASLFAARHVHHSRRIAAVKHAGFFTFLYLELFDFTFSTDSVLSAFAVTPNVVLIAVGLGAGAVWVRAATLYYAHRHTPVYYPYLDKGVHYAIGALALVLLAGIGREVPSFLADGVGLVIIAAAYVASWVHTHRVKRAVLKG